MYILGLVEIGGYAVLARDLTDVAERGLGGFLHNVAELTGEFKLARAVKHSRFDLKHIAAVFGVRQPVHNTDKILVVYLFGHYLACAEIGCDVSLVYRNRLEFSVAVHDLFCCFAAQLGYRAFEITYARLACVAVDDLVYRFIGEPERAAREPVTFYLLGNEMIFGYCQLFAARVA